MSLKVRLYTKSITIPSKVSPIHTFDGEISEILLTKEKVFFLVSQSNKIPFANEKDIDELNNIYCFDLNGNLLWKTGRMEFPTYGGNIFIHPASDMFIEGNQLKLFYQMGLYRWLDVETGEVVKEEYFDNR